MKMVRYLIFFPGVASLETMFASHGNQLTQCLYGDKRVINLFPKPSAIRECYYGYSEVSKN